MAEIPEIKPRETPERPVVAACELPDGARTGQAMFEFAGAHLTEYCLQHNMPHEVAERVLQDAKKWAQAQVGEPVLRLAKEGGSTILVSGGMLRTQLHLTTGFEGKYPSFKFTVNNLDHVGKVALDTVAFGVEELAWAYNGSEQLIEAVVGEQAVSERLAHIGRGLLGSHGEVGDIKNASRILLNAKKALIGIGAFGLDHDQRAELCARVVEGMLSSDQYWQSSYMRALMFAAEVTTPEQFVALFDSVCDQFASVLPLSPDDASAAPIEALEGLWQYHQTHPDILRQAEGAEIADVFVGESKIRFASLVADMYERRTQQEYARQQPDEPLVIPTLAPTVPAPYNLMIFKTAVPKVGDVVKDIAYIRELAAGGWPVTATLERDDVTMDLAIDNLSQYAETREDPVARAEAFLAMEYLFNLQTPLQRDEYYRLMSERFALKMPFERKLNVRSQLWVADTMSRLMPNPLTAPDGTPYTGDARIAAMMTHFYRRRSHQLVMKMRFGYKPLEEGED